jgi:tetratricopeptide (TPR) repeat protein
MADLTADLDRHLAVLTREPENPEALAAVEKLTQELGNGHSAVAAQRLGEARLSMRDRGDYEIALRLLDLELTLTHNPDERANLLFEKAKLLDDELLREPEAIACLNEVLQLRPEDASASEMLSHIALVSPNWQKIVKKYVDEAKASTDRSLATSLYLSAAEIYARHEPAALEVEQYLRKSLEVEPRNRRTAGHLERILERQKRWEELSQIRQLRVESAKTKEERIAALLSLADIAEQKRARQGDALDAYRRVLAVDPGHPRALKALAAAFSASGDWSSLAKLYETSLRSRGRAAESDVATLLELGRLYWQKLQQLDQAEEYYRRVRKAAPAEPEMLDFYRTYHLGRNEAVKLLAVLSQAQKCESDPARKLELGVEMAKAAEADGASIEKAIDHWKGVLRIAPARGEIALQAMAALRRLYQRTEKWNALLELLKEEVDALPADDTSARIERLLQIVEIYRDRLNLDVMVINTYNNILALKPDHLGALDALAQKYESLGRWNDLIGVLGRKAEVISDAGARVVLLRRTAALWIERFGNHNQAIKPLERLLEIAPGDAEAIQTLKDIYSKRRMWRALVDLSEREAMTLAGDARRTRLAEVARLASERLGDARAAIGAWNRVLESDSGHPEALAQLAQLYEREKRYPALVEILRRMRQTVGDDARAAVPLLERMGALWVERLASQPDLARNALDQGASVFREILSLRPGHAKAVRVLREIYVDAANMEALEQLYGNIGAWDELLETLHAAADRAHEVPQKLRLFSRAAEISVEKLKQPERAAKALERILQLDPQNQAAARSLVPIYRGQEKWARLLATYEILLGAARDKNESLSLLADIRRLCEEKLGSKALAFQWCGKAYELAPDDQGLASELARLALEADAWEDLARIYRRRVEAMQADPARESERIGILRELGRLLLGRLGRPEEAEAAFQEILGILPEDPEARAALDQIYTQGQRWNDLLSVHRKGVQLEKDPSRRLEALFKIAFIEEERAGDFASAVDTYNQILLADHGNMRALRALEKLHQARSSWPELARVYEQQLPLVADEQRVGLLLGLGGLLDLRLGDTRKAIEFYRKALELQQQNRGAVAALERLLPNLANDDPERVACARLLSPFYERESDAAHLAGELSVLRQTEKDADVRLGLDRRLTFLYSRKLGDGKRAFQHAIEVLGTAPGDAENRKEAAALAADTDGWAELASRLGAARESAVGKGAADLARDVLWEQACIVDEKLGDGTKAEELYRKVLTEQPAHEGAYDALERLLRGREAWKDLRALLEARQAGLPDPDKRREVLFQITDLDLGVLDDEEGARAIYERILEIDPRSSRAYTSLLRLHENGKRSADLEALLARQQAFVEDPAERAAILFRRGSLKANSLTDPAGAVDLFEETLGIDRKHAAARKALEELLAKADLRLRIARILEPLYAEDKDPEKLIGALRAQREFARTPAEAVELYSRIARIEEEDVGSRQRALATWREALRTDPSDSGTREAVDRLTDTLSLYEEAAEAWEEAIKVAPPGDLSLRAELFRRAAQVYDHRLNDSVKATELYRQLLEVDPTNSAVLAPAAEALERIFTASERWTDLVDLLRREAEWADDVPARKAILFRVAEIQEVAQSDTSGAIATFREILEHDAEERKALGELERLYKDGRQWRELVEVLRRRVEHESAMSERRQIRARIARVLEDDVGAPTEAIAAYHELLDEAPEDGEALGELARLYRQSSRWPDLLDSLERRLSLLTGSAERVQILAEIAQILDERLERKADAFERYSEILHSTPDHEGARVGIERLLTNDELRFRAAEVLEPLYETGSERDKLISLHELLAEHTADPHEKLARLRRAATLYEQRADPGAAFEALARAGRAALAEPELDDILAGLERLAKSRGAEDELARLYQDIEPDVLDGDIKLRLNLRVAQIAHGKADLATAREFFRRVVDTNATHDGAMTALEEIYAAREEWEPLLEIYLRRVEMAGDDLDEREKRLLQAARLCDEKLGRTQDAILSYEQLLEIAPANSEGARALDRLYQQTGRWQELADHLERRLGLADDLSEAVNLRFRLGEIWEQKLSDPDKAVENYSAVLSGEPGHAAAVAALERYLDDPGQRAQAAEILEPIYAGRHEWPRLIRIYEIRLAATDAPEARIGFSRRLARLYEEQLEDLDGAFQWYGKVFREDPADRWTRDQLVRLASVLGRWDALGEVYAGYLHDTVEESATTLEIARQLAQIYDQRLGDVVRARDAYRRILSAQPDDAAVLEALVASLTRAERWPDLLEVWAEAAERALDPVRKKAHLFRICQLQEEVLKDRAQAILAYRAVLDVDGEDAQAITGLDRLLTVDERWPDLADLIQRRLERATPEDALTLRRRLGGLLETKLDDLPAAIDTYERILAEHANDTVAVAALERLVLVQDHRHRIALILEPIYRAADEWAKLAVILDAELPFIDDRLRRVELLHEISQLHETRGGRLDLAFAAAARAFREDISSEEDLANLERLAERSGAWEAVIRELEAATEGLYDTELAARLLGRAATLEETRRNDLRRAIDLWRKVLAIHDDNPEALPALERLLGLEGRHAELVKILERRAELASDPLEQRDFLARTAGLYEQKLGDAEHAVSSWKAVLNVVDDDAEALSALARLHESAGAHRDRVQIYQRQIELAADPAAKIALLFRAAEVHEAHLQDTVEAIGAYRQLLELAPGEPKALEALDRLYVRERQWPELLEILEARIAGTPDPAARADLRFRSGLVLEEGLGDAPGAIDRHDQVLADVPTHPGARKVLWRLLRGDDHREAAARVLEPVLRQQGSFDELVELSELRLAANQDPSERRTLFANIAELHEHSRQDPAQAFHAWARAFAEDPAAVEIEAELERLARSRGAFGELAACLEERLVDAIDAELGRRLSLKLADIYEQELHDAGKAAAKLRQALAYQGDERGPLASLDRIYSRAGATDELAEILAREAEVAPSPAEQAGFLFRLGELREARHDGAGALASYRDVVERDPHHDGARLALERMLHDAELRSDAIAVLEQLYEADGDYTRLAELLELKLGTLSDHGDRARLLERVAEIAEKRLGDKVRALDAVGRALSDEPSSEAFLGELERLASETQRWAEAAARLTDVLAAFDRSAPPDLERELSHHLGSILVEHLGDDKSAEPRFVTVLRLDPEHQGALQALEGIYRRLQNGARLADILDRRSEGELDPTKRRGQLAEVAVLRESQGDRGAAVAAWRKVLDLEESDSEGLAALCRLYDDAKQWEDLVGILELQAKHAETAVKQRALRARIADVLADKIADLDRATQAYRDVVDLAPTDDAALLSLERVLAKREDWLAVQEVLVRRLDIAPAPQAKVLLFERLAQIAEEKRESVDEACGYLHQILDLDGRNAKAMAELERLLAKAERWHDLIEILTRRADQAAQAGDAKNEIASLAKAADIWERNLSSPDAAGELLERILTRDPGYVPALMTLAKIYEGQNNLEQCVETLRRALSLTANPAESAELCFRLGKIEGERTGDGANAVPWYEEALRRDPGHAASLAELEKIARETGDSARLADILQRREATAAPEAKLPILKELAQLYVDKLGQPQGAVPLLEKALAIAPQDAAIMEPLADTYFAAQRNADAARLYQALAAERLKARRMKDVARFRQRLGALAERQGDSAAALKEYEEANKLDATHAATLASLGRLYFVAASQVTDAAKALPEWEKARKVYRSMLLQNLDPSAGISKAEVYLQLGLIHARLGEAPKAKNMYERGLEIDANHAGLRQALSELR